MSPLHLGWVLFEGVRHCGHARWSLVHACKSLMNNTYLLKWYGYPDLLTTDSHCLSRDVPMDVLKGNYRRRRVHCVSKVETMLPEFDVEFIAAVGICEHRVNQSKETTDKSRQI